MDIKEVRNMSELCILNSNKTCNDCGECDKCDLNNAKICNNCGKCLELQGYDRKIVKIDSIINDSNETENIESSLEITEFSTEKYDNLDITDESDLLDDDYTKDYEENLQVTSIEDLNSEFDKEPDYEFIDDIDGLNEILEDEEKLRDITDEQFPGLYIIKTKK
jgi:hypothetical protein